MEYRDPQKEATARYNKKAYDRIELRVKKGDKARIRLYAEAQGKSLNRFIVDLIGSEMTRCELTTPPICRTGPDV